MSAAVAWSPSSSATGSPEASRVRQNTSTATRASTTTAPPRRFNRNRIMVLSAPAYLAKPVFQKNGQMAGV